MDPNTASSRHPIQVVSRRTGLSAEVIRAWERRYRVVTPLRAAGSRRLYSDIEIERLRRLYKLTQAGRRIGDIASLSDAQLADLLAEDEAAAAARPSVPAAPPASAREHLEACLHAVEEMDPRALDAALGRAAVALSLPLLLEEVVAGVLREVGRRWRSGELRVSQEHLASARIRTFLGALHRNSASPEGGGPKLVVSTPRGHLHELGALMAAVVAAADGWSTLYLGPGTPAEELAAAAIRGRARAVALSLPYVADELHLLDELRRLRHELPAEVPVLVGGGATASRRELLEQSGAVVLPGLADLRRELATLT